MISGLRILALEIRAGQFAFVYLERASKLIDCGVRRCRAEPKRGASTAADAMARAFDRCQPTLVIIRRSEENAISAAARREARARSVPVRSVSWAAVRKFFRAQGCRNKQARATVIAEWYPELQRKLPAERKVQHGEPYHMLIFDAAAAAVAYFASR